MSDRNSAPSPPAVISVLGAGVMGQGIAQLCAQSGCRTLLYDVSSEVSHKALQNIEKSLQLRVDRGRLSASEATDTLRRLEIVSTLAALAESDLVVEAVVEDLAIKHQLIRELEQHCRPDTLLCTNTSSLSVTDIAAVAQHPERVAGLHFFNPAPVMKLIEVIQAPQTSEAVIEQLCQLARDLGKIPVVAKDSPAFVVNRCARPFYSEPLVMLAEGLADMATLDQAIQDNAGTPLGPFELMDLVGLDINLKATTTVWAAFAHHPRFAPSPAVHDRVAQGQLGRKTGRGFYDYSADRASRQQTDSPPAVANARALADQLATRQPFRVAVSDGRLAREAANNAPLLWLDQNLVSWQRHPVTLACTHSGLGAAELEQACAEAAARGVHLVPIADRPGLIAQRLAVMLEQEASRVVEEGVAPAQDIDTALRYGLNFRAGPFTLNADIDDTCAEHILERLRADDDTGRYED
ncbi:3-hydroxyacyl-CoA dehydrogenase [Natronospirillum operosum]|uniref:3-hydroxyacyl-CoA dehydrogenase n=1 Tax=Natronospirillum operosum TaxID=2759953 RepID=A0A4Z0WFN1_9GAMM|nr:3-hydroxyacyl-CoA dehydrogenase NAD-binding domain-containing protein [Natronospirillum operosum]TGG93358.1 3-hydroxyacyl-CoA dehydrogenase [Natronospirillum operosum]